MDRKHTSPEFNPFVSTQENDVQIEYTRLTCQCISRNTHEELRSHLETANQAYQTLNDAIVTLSHSVPSSIRNAQKKLKAHLKALEKVQRDNAQAIQKYCSNQKEFSRNVSEQIKRHAINVPPNRAPLVLEPYNTTHRISENPSKSVFLKRNAPPIIPAPPPVPMVERMAPDRDKHGSNQPKT